MISNRIAYLRRSIGLSQSELAKKLHISTSAEGMYEQGRRTPSITTLIQLSRIFNVSLDYLITGTEFVPSSQSEQSKHDTISCPYLRMNKNNQMDRCRQRMSENETD